jgi:hypothetical protein
MGMVAIGALAGTVVRHGAEIRKPSGREASRREGTVSRGPWVDARFGVVVPGTSSGLKADDPRRPPPLGARAGEEKTRGEPLLPKRKAAS